MELGENPFGAAGAIVVGEDFIGRRSELRRLRSRCLSRGAAGSYSITGLPKIGKSSLAWNLLFSQEIRATDFVIPVWLNLATFSSLDDLLVALAGEVLQSINNGPNPAPEALCDAAGGNLFGEALRQATVKYLAAFLRGPHPQRVVAVIDEFDVAREVFGDEADGAFRFLRHLAYEPRHKLTWITVSRRSLRTIVSQSGSSDSPFPNIFQHLKLSLFGSSEVEEMANRAPNLRFVDDMNVLDRLTAGHPYLAAIALSSAWWLNADSEAVTEERLLEATLTDFVEYYIEVYDYLEKDEQLDRLVQVLCGPVINVSQYDVYSLKDNGLVRLDAEGRYLGFSEHFEQWFSIYARQIDIWPLWGRTERAIRSAVRDVLFERFGAGWEESLSTEIPGMANDVERWHQQRRRGQVFGSEPADILDFTYPLDLFRIVAKYWNKFENRLGNNKSYWEQQFQLLSKVRTPLAHNRDVDAGLLHRAETVCEDILKRLGVE
jgi:hypothetical protein